MSDRTTVAARKDSQMHTGSRAMTIEKVYVDRGGLVSLRILTQ